MASQRRGNPTFLFTVLAIIVSGFFVNVYAAVPAVAQESTTVNYLAPSWNAKCVADGTAKCVLPGPDPNAGATNVPTGTRFILDYGYGTTSYINQLNNQTPNTVVLTQQTFTGTFIGRDNGNDYYVATCVKTDGTRVAGGIVQFGSSAPACTSAAQTPTDFMELKGFGAAVGQLFKLYTTAGPASTTGQCFGNGGFAYATVQHATERTVQPYTYSVRTLNGTVLTGGSNMCQSNAHANAASSAGVNKVEIFANGVLVYRWTIGPPALDIPPQCSLADIQLVQLARAAGFLETDIPTAVAVALAESGGRVGALNLNTNGTYDIGLWQINDGVWTMYDRKLLATNPLYNAIAAKEIRYQAPNTWAPWVTFKTGAYVKFMTRANEAYRQFPTGVLPLTNCNGALGNADDPLYNTPPTVNPDGSVSPGGANTSTNSRDYCGFSVNPLNYLKCLFLPSDVTFRQWDSLRQTAVQKPPVSVINGGYQFVNGIMSQYGECTQAQVGTGGCQQTYEGKIKLPGSQTTSPEFRFNPFNAAGTYAKDSSVYQNVLNIIRFGLWMGFALYLFRRIGNSFGSKQNGEDTM